MNQPIDIGALLKLRKVTRAVADELRSGLQKHLATLAPLLMTRQVFGRHADGDPKHSVRGEDEAFAELSKLYAGIARSQEFALPPELESPLRIRQTSLAVCPAEYVYQAADGDQSKQLTIVSPTRWVLFPSGCEPADLREAIANQSTSAEELRRLAVHYLALHVLLSRRPNTVDLFKDLRFPITSGKLAGCGELPVSIIESPAQTIRASDDVIIQSTELAGTDTFEEVLDETAVANMVDPLRSRVLSLMESVN